MRLYVQIITFSYQHETLRWLDSISLLNSILCDLCSFGASKPCWISSASLLFQCTTSIPINIIGPNQCTTSTSITLIGLTKKILRCQKNGKFEKGEQNLWKRMVHILPNPFPPFRPFLSFLWPQIVWFFSPQILLVQNELN